MTCYNPLHAFPDGLTKDGKTHYKITSNKVKSVLFDNGHWYLSTDPFQYSNNNPIDVPCGRCIGCRIDYSRSWALRCMLESLYHEQSWFLTLTYDDIHVPHSSYTDFETGEIKDILTLCPDDFTKFMKRLRINYSRKTGKEIRFFACGEYGSKTLRPHYHAIVFGLELDDLKPLKKSHTNNQLFESEFVSNSWHDKGYVQIGECNFQSCAYVARYIMKKRKGADSLEYEYFNIVPEFIRMSRNPGLAYQYYQDYKEQIYKNDEIILSDGKKFKPPKYFDEMYQLDFPEKFEEIKQNRIRAAQIIDDTKEYYFGDKYARLSREELAKSKAIVKLARDLE